MPVPKLNPPIDFMANYTKAVADSPNSAEAHTNLGWGHYGRKEYELALKAFDKALSLQGDTLDALYGRALALRGLGRPTEAVQAFERAQVINDQSEDKNRHFLLSRLLKGQINETKTGDWNMGPIF